MADSTFNSFFQKIRFCMNKEPDSFLKNITGVIHVGANTGQERDLYHRHGLDVIWVEPIPSVFNELKAFISGFEKQAAHQYLVTDKDNSKYEFHIANNNGASSSIFALDLHKDIWPEVDYVSSISLESVTLKTLIEKEDIDISKYQALIMDTQGSELLILQGASSLLHHFRYVKTEVPDFESYKHCCQLKEMNSYLKKYKFREYSRDLFAQRKQGGNYYDITYKRRIF